MVVDGQGETLRKESHDYTLGMSKARTGSHGCQLHFLHNSRLVLEKDVYRSLGWTVIMPSSRLEERYAHSERNEKHNRWYRDFIYKCQFYTSSK